MTGALLWSSRPIHVDLAHDGPTTGWTDYGNDRRGSRYSPVTQITKENVKHLEIAWEYRTGDVSDGEGRIFMGTNDARLIAVDADTGKPCEDFGVAGTIDLKKGPGGEEWFGEYQVTSPPAIAGDLVVVGSAISDSHRTDAPSGVVRAFNVRSGELAWDWDLRPPNYDPPADMISEGGYMLGTPNVWAPKAVDEERSMIIVPTGNPSPDYYGGMRDGANYYGSSIVALDSKTGTVKWNFQTVHHDLWDFDVPCQPTLVDVQYNGETIPAAIQATKMGLLFCLNRETGEPIYGIEEREVPQSNVPGEETSPTQPFPIKPPPLVPSELAAEDAWGLVGLGKAGCRDLLESMHFEGMYTPPQLEKLTMRYPGNAGGSNWGGIGVDPERQIVISNTMDLPWGVTVIERDNIPDWREKFPDAEFSMQTGTPYAMMRVRVLSSLGLPCNPPPWGTLAAVDLKSGEILWQEPFGTVRDIAPVPVPIKDGVPSLGGPITTGSGLVFIGAALDNYLRTYDIETGKELWKGRLPTGGQATPMTYRLSDTGKQYVVIAAGGHARAGSTLGDSVVAFALPE